MFDKFLKDQTEHFRNFMRAFEIFVIYSSYSPTVMYELKEKDYETWAFLNPLSANPTKWSNTLKQFVGC